MKKKNIAFLTIFLLFSQQTLLSFSYNLDDYLRDVPQKESGVPLGGERESSGANEMNRPQMGRYENNQPVRNDQQGQNGEYTSQNPDSHKDGRSLSSEKSLKTEDLNRNPGNINDQKSGDNKSSDVSKPVGANAEPIKTIVDFFKGAVSKIINATEPSRDPGFSPSHDTAGTAKPSAGVVTPDINGEGVKSADTATPSPLNNEEKKLIAAGGWNILRTAINMSPEYQNHLYHKLAELEHRGLIQPDSQFSGQSKVIDLGILPVGSIGLDNLKINPSFQDPKLYLISNQGKPESNRSGTLPGSQTDPAFKVSEVKQSLTVEGALASEANSNKMDNVVGSKSQSQESGLGQSIKNSIVSMIGSIVGAFNNSASSDKGSVESIKPSQNLSSKTKEDNVAASMPEKASQQETQLDSKPLSNQDTMNKEEQTGKETRFASISKSEPVMMLDPSTAKPAEAGEHPQLGDTKVDKNGDKYVFAEVVPPEKQAGYNKGLAMNYPTVGMWVQEKPVARLIPGTTKPSIDSGFYVSHDNTNPSIDPGYSPSHAIADTTKPAETGEDPKLGDTKVDKNGDRYIFAEVVHPSALAGYNKGLLMNYPKVRMWVKEDTLMASSVFSDKSKFDKSLVVHLFPGTHENQQAQTVKPESKLTSGQSGSGNIFIHNMPVADSQSKTNKVDVAASMPEKTSQQETNLVSKSLPNQDTSQKQETTAPQVKKPEPQSGSKPGFFERIKNAVGGIFLGKNETESAQTVKPESKPAKGESGAGNLLSLNTPVVDSQSKTNKVDVAESMPQKTSQQETKLASKPLSNLDTTYKDEVTGNEMRFVRNVDGNKVTATTYVKEGQQWVPVKTTEKIAEGETVRTTTSVRNGDKWVSVKQTLVTTKNGQTKSYDSTHANANGTLRMIHQEFDSNGRGLQQITTVDKNNLAKIEVTLAYGKEYGIRYNATGRMNSKNGSIEITSPFKKDESSDPKVFLGFKESQLGGVIEGLNWGIALTVGYLGGPKGFQATLGGLKLAEDIGQMKENDPNVGWGTLVKDGVIAGLPLAGKIPGVASGTGPVATRMQGLEEMFSGPMGEYLKNALPVAGGWSLYGLSGIGHLLGGDLAGFKDRWSSPGTVVAETVESFKDGITLGGPINKIAVNPFGAFGEKVGEKGFTGAAMETITKGSVSGGVPQLLGDTAKAIGGSAAVSGAVENVAKNVELAVGMNLAGAGAEKGTSAVLEELGAPEPAQKIGGAIASIAGMLFWPGAKNSASAEGASSEPLQSNVKADTKPAMLPGNQGPASNGGSPGKTETVKSNDTANSPEMPVDLTKVDLTKSAPPTYKPGATAATDDIGSGDTEIIIAEPAHNSGSKGELVDMEGHSIQNILEMEAMNIKPGDPSVLVNVKGSEIRIYEKSEEPGNPMVSGRAGTTIGVNYTKPIESQMDKLIKGDIKTFSGVSAGVVQSVGKELAAMGRGKIIEMANDSAIQHEAFHVFTNQAGIGKSAKMPGDQLMASATKEEGAFLHELATTDPQMVKGILVELANHANSKGSMAHSMGCRMAFNRMEQVLGQPGLFHDGNQNINDAIFSLSPKEIKNIAAAARDNYLREYLPQVR